jgi:hypothetical protein
MKLLILFELALRVLLKPFTESSEWQGSPTRLHAKVNSHAHYAPLLESPLHSTKGRGGHILYDHAASSPALTALWKKP